MARIYETQKDIEQDKLSRQVVKLKNETKYTTLASLSEIVLGITFLSDARNDRKLRSLGETVKTVFNERVDRAINLTLGYGSLALAAVGAGFAVYFHTKKNKLQKELEALGPVDVVVPAGSSYKLQGPESGTVSEIGGGFLDKVRAEREAITTSQRGIV